jgi:hypothetical protein
MIDKNKTGIIGLIAVVLVCAIALVFTFSACDDDVKGPYVSSFPSRTVTVTINDSIGDGWQDGGKLIIKVKGIEVTGVSPMTLDDISPDPGTNYADPSTLTKLSDSKTFNISVGDKVTFEWSVTGDPDPDSCLENSFIARIGSTTIASKSTGQITKANNGQELASYTCYP